MHLFVFATGPDRYSISDGSRKDEEQRSENILLKVKGQKEMGGGCHEFNSKLAKAKS